MKISEVNQRLLLDRSERLLNALRDCYPMRILSDQRRELHEVVRDIYKEYEETTDDRRTSNP